MNPKKPLDPLLYSIPDPTLELASLFKLQLARIEAMLKRVGPSHASGPRKPTLSQLESTQKKT